MNVNTRQLQAFLAVARLQSVTRAAEQIHLSQAGLSLMLREMESQIGVRLFDRTTRSVTLTEAGRQLIPSAERMLREWGEVSARLDKLSLDVAHTLTVVATPLVCSSVMPMVLGALQRVHPDIKVVVRDMERGHIEAPVLAGEADMALGILLKAASGVRRQRLLSLPLVCVSPREWPAGRKPRGLQRLRVAWSDLVHVPLIGLSATNPIQQVIDLRLREIGRANEARATFNNLHSVVAMVEAGYGAAVMPAFVQGACSRYAVNVSVMTGPEVPLDFHAITRKGAEVTAAAHAFLEAFTTQLRQYPQLETRGDPP
jgi:DNA-binding transcriptional LysR family regulator